MAQSAILSALSDLGVGPSATTQRSRMLTLIALCLAGCAACADTRPSGTADLLLSNVNVIDVSAGVVVEAQDVLISGNTIAGVVPHGSARSEATVVLDLSGMYVMPGLWDMHAHVRSYNMDDVLPLFVVYGVTGIRDLGLTSFTAIAEAQGEIAAQSIIGPRIISSGFIIEGPQPRFPTSVSIAGLQHVAAALDSVAAAGVEIIKVFENLEGPVYEAVVANAREKGLLTAGHIPNDWSQIRAANAGLHSIEHLWGLAGSLSLEGGRLDLSAIEDLARVLVEHGTFECPTLVNNRVLTDRFFRQHPDLAMVPTYHLSWWERLRAVPLTAEAQQRQEAQVEFAKAATRELAARGVRFLAGTDTPNPYVPAGISLHKELELFVEAGLTTAEALRTATVYPAEYFNRTTQLGAVAEGYAADLVVLEADPLENIQNTQTIVAVITDGRLFSDVALAEIRNAQARRMADYKTSDLDQRVYMEVRRGGIDNARSLFPAPFDDARIVARPEHLARLSEVLAAAGEVEEARKALDWNLELFPDHEASRSLLESIARRGGR